MTKCTIEDCAKDAHKRTWCTTHYGRYQRHGDPRAKVRGWYRDPEDAFRARVTPDGDCLAWTGALDDKGYGNMYVGGKYVAAHRYAWERANGPIPEGMVIDHECWNARCVNVGHLRIATHAENMRYHRGANSDSSTGIRGIWLDKGRYRTKIVLNGETVYRASFSTPEDAGAAADRERRAAYGAFAGNG